MSPTNQHGSIFCFNTFTSTQNQLKHENSQYHTQNKIKPTIKSNVTNNKQDIGMKLSKIVSPKNFQVTPTNNVFKR